MNRELLLKNLKVPEERVDVILDTDAFNELDDQFAIAYMLRSVEKLNTKALYAAPFYNENSDGPADGMEKSYNEILKITEFMNEKTEVFRGSDKYLPDENTPVMSDAARDLAQRAMNYTPENPLYVVAIGAITNIASAMLINPEICERIVVVWLGGHALHWENTKEFNMYQDIAAARVVMSSESPFVQLPCMGVVSEFRISEPELEFWLKGKNAIANYLAENTINVVNSYAKGTAWTRVIWDVTAVAWLLNDNERFMHTRIIPTRLPEYSGAYSEAAIDKPMCYAYLIERDNLMTDLVKKLSGAVHDK